MPRRHRAKRTKVETPKISPEKTLPISIKASGEKDDIYSEPANQIEAYTQLQSFQENANVSSVLANFPTLKLAKAPENEKRPWTKAEVFRVKLS